MKILGRYRISKQIAVCLIVVLGLPLSDAMAVRAQEPANPQPAQQVQPAQDQQQPAAPALETRSQAAEPQEPPAPQHPVGTAAAPVTKPSGVAGSRPAGAAIAPAKQRRVRRIIIRFGIILGAAAAVGTVAALSHSSPSHP